MTMSTSRSRSCGPSTTGTSSTSPRSAPTRGVTASELAESLSDPEGRERMRIYRSVAIPASSVAVAIAFAMDQPANVDVDVDEIIVRPTAGRT